MTETCKGCGVILQNTDKNALGYTPKPDGDYCQRCFRMNHYGDVTISMQQGIEAEKTFAQLADLDADVFWVVDLFNLEESLISRLNQKLPGKEIIMIATKSDVLPSTLSEGKLRRYLYSRLKEEGIRVKDILITGHMLDRSRENEAALEELKDGIARNLDKDTAVFLGVANAGKSTLINRLLDIKQLTTSRNPGTTLDLVKLQLPQADFYDTPGIENHHSYLSFLNAADLKTVIPTGPVKPRIFQIDSSQSFAVGGLVRLDVWCDKKATVVAYFANSLNVHRSKLERADDLWQKHYGEMFTPVYGSQDEMQSFTAPKIGRDSKLDIYIYGLGWFSLSGNITKAVVSVHKDVYVSFRKALV